MCCSRASYALINGIPLKENFPIIKLEFKNKSHFCSGTFIDSKTILTAAHCITKPKKKWDGFSLDLEFIKNSSGEKINFEFDQLIPHPLYRKGALPSRNDVGIIKFKSIDYKGLYPRVGSKSAGKVTLYGCGIMDLKTRERKCQQGENELHSFMGYFFTVGTSRRSKPYGENVSVAWNDSGGAIIDNYTKKVIGVHRGAWLDFPAKWSLPSVSFMTSFSEKSNIDFIKRYVEGDD